MILDEEHVSSDDTSSSSITFVPLELRLNDTESARNLIKKVKENIDSGEEPLSDDEISIIIDESAIGFHAYTGDTSETLVNIVNATGTEPDEAMVRAVNCCDILKKVGAELIIYSLSFGGLGVLTGVFMRYAHTDKLASMLIGNGIAVLANENARAFFTSLINPHGESVPDDKKALHETIKKYLAHPISTVITSTINGGTVALSGSTDLGTRQIIVSITAQLGGLTTYFGQSIVRQCFGGSIVIKPREKSPKETMVDFYSTKPNPSDENRTYIGGNVRNILTRVVGMTLATTTTWFTGLYNLETYCGPGQDELLKYNGNFTVDELNQYCTGGQFTIMFRDWGVTAVGLVGFLVVQPLLNYAANKIFDYFWPPQPATNDEPLIEEVSSDDESGDDRFYSLGSDSDDMV